jgi:ABC-2 type transport system permease protein
MLRGLWRLTWLEIKIFVREPLGVIGSIAIPVVVFVVMNRLGGGASGQVGRSRPPAFMNDDLTVLACLLIALSAVMSLVTIVAIYREGGILKRLRATPLRPHTILTAHVIVKLLFSALTLVALLLAGKRYIPTDGTIPLGSFALAVLSAR